jgi:hypothetical protein
LGLPAHLKPKKTRLNPTNRLNQNFNAGLVSSLEEAKTRLFICMACMLALLLHLPFPEQHTHTHTLRSFARLATRGCREAMASGGW